MSKAFHKVHHDVLIQRLRKVYGFRGNLLRWFRSYLTNREQCVTVLGAKSNLLSITSGVPQGSILGPALFLLYINDLPSSVKTSQLAMFADDTKLFKEIQTTNDAEQLQNDINIFETWSTTSSLLFNETTVSARLKQSLAILDQSLASTH